MVRRLIRLSDHRCTCISNVRICLEKGLILIKNVKVSTLGLRLHLRKTKQGGGKKKSRPVRKHSSGQGYSGELPGLQSQGKTEMCSTINEGTVGRKNDVCQEYF